MDRRLAGLGVLILVVVAAAVVPSLSGRRVAGSAVAETFRDPPAIGDCAVSAPSGQDGSFGEPSSVDASAVTWGPCNGPIVGEVVAFQSSDHEPMSPAAGWEGPCFRAAAAFAGLDVTGPSVAVPGAPSTNALSWEPAIGATIQRVVPGDEERRAGRSWLACLVTTSSGHTYRGTLAQGFGSGRVPDEYGLCWNGTDLDEAVDLIPCDQVHSTQLLAVGSARDRSLVSQADLEAACRDIATVLMRTERPVDAGELVTVVDVTDDVDTPDAPLTVGCLAAAAGQRQLNGSVIGLDDRPVPFAS
jgi:hypothetical protein